MQKQTKPRLMRVVTRHVSGTCLHLQKREVRTCLLLQCSSLYSVYSVQSVGVSASSHLPLSCVKRSFYHGTRLKYTLWVDCVRGGGRVRAAAAVAITSHLFLTASQQRHVVVFDTYRLTWIDIGFDKKIRSKFGA